MAYVNVKDWTDSQVALWLKGLDSSMHQYTESFINNGVTGKQLLNLRTDVLQNLGVWKLGHQEIILEAVEHLRNFHYELEKENLQTLALRLSCDANSLFRELLLVNDDCQVVPNQFMSDVHNIITRIKHLVCWLDRSPFTGDKEYIDNKASLMQFGFEIATCAHRDKFSDHPVKYIRQICEKLVKIADHLIQEISDPMILQPASLDLATLKKKERELGFMILPSNHGIHQIAEVIYGSPAHGVQKIEIGDEIVQVNYQTVVGWERKSVLGLFEESSEVVLTLKKRPRHTKVYGQIYMKPYRLPSRKKDAQNWSRWKDNLPSPRLMDLPPITIPKLPVVSEPEDVVSGSSSDSEPPDSPLDGSMRVYPLKPRPILQRRNTITGATPTSKRPYVSIDTYWDFLQSQMSTKHNSSYNIDQAKFEDTNGILRDKSVSCNTGLDLSPRPTTIGACLVGQSIGGSRGASFKRNHTPKKHVNFDDQVDVNTIESPGKKLDISQSKNSENLDSNAKKVVLENDKKVDLLSVTNLNEQKSISVNSLASLTEDISYIDEGRELTDRSSMVDNLSKDNSEKDNLVKDNFTKDNLSKDYLTKDNLMKDNLVKDPTLAEVNIHNIIKKFDQPPPPKPKVLPRTEKPKTGKKLEKPQVPPRSATTKLRGRLDKSHSTPAYDLGEENPAFNPKFERMPERLPDLIPEQPPIANLDTSAPFTEKNYELGIPIVEAVNYSIIQNGGSTKIANSDPVDKFDSGIISKLTEKVEETKLNDDLPPKPPPRTFGIEMPKPAYPSDSPKPQNLIDLAKSHQQPIKKQVFDFPDVKTSNLDTKIMDSKSRKENVILKSQLQNFEPFDSKFADKSVIINDDKMSKSSFEPKMVSTPISKVRPDIEGAGALNDIFKVSTTPSYEIQKSDMKVSPTNSIVKALAKNKSGKKKNNLISKRRRVTVNDLTPAEIQGFLYQRLRDKHNQNVHWEKRWFVLLGHCLYGFKNKDDPRAACLIFLSGFTVALANEVKSRSNAFKVYHTGTVFYFSADDMDALQSWTELIKSATLHTDLRPNNSDNSALYSETDESDIEKCDKSRDKPAESLKKFGSLKKLKNPSSTQSTSLDRKWFFNKSSNSKNSLPVPTAQYRSYRKMRVDAPSSVTTGNFTSHVGMFGNFGNNLINNQNQSVPNLTVDPASNYEKFGKVAGFSASNSSGFGSNSGISVNSTYGSSSSCSNTGSNIYGFNSAMAGSNSAIAEKSTEKTEFLLPPKGKPKPINYIHASNPSLCNNDFNLVPPPIIPNLRKQPNTKRPENLDGFMTLEELMIKQTEERKLNPHHIVEEMASSMKFIRPDVVYGEVPIRPQSYEAPPDEQKKKKHSHSRSSSNSSSITPSITASIAKEKKEKISSKDKESSCFGKRLGSLKKSKHEDEYSKRGCLEKNWSLPRSASNTARNFQNLSAHSTSDKNLAYEMIHCRETVNNINFAQNRNLDKSSSSSTISSAGGKIKKQHSFSESDSKRKLKSATSYTPMALPLKDGKHKQKYAVELNLDEKVAVAPAKSGGKIKQILGVRKKDDKSKEKGKVKGSDADFASKGGNSQTNSLDRPEMHQFVGEPLLAISPPIDYPDMEYPPVFEPETYSLADPQSSLSILRKQQQQSKRL